MENRGETDTDQDDSFKRAHRALSRPPWMMEQELSAAAPVS